MTKETRPFSEIRQERLRIPEVAAAYLNVAKAQSQEVFLKALRRVAQARQITKVAKDAGVQRETLYHALSEVGNPTIETFASVLSVLDLDFVVHPKTKANISECDDSGPQDGLRSIQSGIEAKYGGGLDEELSSLAFESLPFVGQQAAESEYLVGASS